MIGFCLGHQLLLNHLKGIKIIKSSKLIHGQAVRLKEIPDQSVCRYNSWTCDVNNVERSYLVFDEFGELAMYKDNQLLTMQFHPESVGTSCPEYFFQMVHSFVLHNIRDERR